MNKISVNIATVLTVLVMIAVISGAMPIPRNVKRPFPNSQFAVLDSSLVHYRLWVTNVKPAKGKLLFVHGFMGSTYSFRKCYDSLCAAGFNILSMDRPPFGYGSRDIPADYSVYAMGRLIWRMADEIDLGDTSRWDIIGHCTGGSAAEAAAIIRPGRVRSLILTDATFFERNNGKMTVGFDPMKIKGIKGIYSEYLSSGTMDFPRLRSLLQSGYGRLPDTSDVTGYLLPLRIPGTADAIDFSLKHPAEKKPLDCKAIAKLPVLVIWGEKDSWIPKSAVKKIKKLLPACQVKIIPGAGHMPMETEPEEFRRILLEFLSRLRT